MWNFDHHETRRIYRAWRKCVRRIFCLPGRTHCALLRHIIRDEPIDQRFHRLFLKYIRSSAASQNELVRSSVEIALMNPESCVNKNFSVICSLYQMSRYDLDTMKPVTLVPQYDSDDVIHGKLIRDLVDLNI